MATSADILCNICEGQNIKNLAESWCPECEEGLCSECKIHHNISKFTKSHEVISVENFKKCPEHILSISKHCKEHEKLYTNYCPDHECLCCPVCIHKKHKQCMNMLLVDDILKTAKSSSLLESIEESIRDLKQNLAHIVLQQDHNLAQNQQERKMVLAEIVKTRRCIDKHFEQLEKKINQEISAAEVQIKLDIEKCKSELKKKRHTLENLEHDIVSVKRYASDLQTCLGSMTLKKKVQQEEEYLMSLQEKGVLKMRLIKCNINEQIISTTAAIKTFGTMSIEESPLVVDLMHNKQRAQITRNLSATISKSIDDINVTFKCTWNVPAGKNTNNITGCVIQPDGKIVLLDRYNNDRVLILKEKGELEKEKKFPSGSKPTDVTCVDDDTVCVSFWDNRLEMIDTVTYKTTQVLKTSHFCCGVTSDNGNLIWYEQYKGIQMKQKSNDTITTLVEDDSGSYWSYLTVHDNKIYQTHHNNNTVTCYKMNGDKVWHFEDKTVITYPTGITVDNASNVYVISNQDEVVILSPDGKSTRQILTKDNKLDNPRAVYFDKNKNILLVSNLNGQVCVYSVL